MGKKLGIFLAGGAVGAAIVYFTSPRSGFENRNLAKDAINTALEANGVDTSGIAAQASQVAQNVATHGQKLAQQAAEKTQEFYATAATKVQEVATGAYTSVTGAADNDELRNKIEAARQRIAAQVVKNAEDAQLVDVEAVADYTDVPLEAADAQSEDTASDVAQAAHASTAAAAEAGEAVENAAGNAAEGAGSVVEAAASHEAVSSNNEENA